jgi:hypothetical protein
VLRQNLVYVLGRSSCIVGGNSVQSLIASMQEARDSQYLSSVWGLSHVGIVKVVY